MMLRRRKKSVNWQHLCDRPRGLTQHSGHVVHLGSATDEYLWHSQWIGGVGGLEVGLWCHNYNGAIDRNGGWSKNLSWQSKVLRFRLQGDIAAMVIDVTKLNDLRGT